jgi:hypothetical protein
MTTPLTHEATTHLDLSDTVKTYPHFINGE